MKNVKNMLWITRIELSTILAISNMLFAVSYKMLKQESLFNKEYMLDDVWWMASICFFVPVENLEC